MSGKQAKRWFVSGEVQGVGFRYFVQNKAAAMGLVGWARNLSDGRVEVYAEGPAARLNDLAGALRVGPRAARVRTVDERDEHPENLSAFVIR
jgi:acylphosphatase